MLITFSFYIWSLLCTPLQNLKTYACILEGTVFDPSGAVVVDNSVVLADAQSGLIRAKAALSRTGTYHIVVPPGTYTLSLADTRMILPFRRAAFHLEPGRHILDIWPVFRSGTELRINGDFELQNPAVSYDEFYAKNAPRQHGVLIRYTARRSVNGTVQYSGKVLMLSSGLLTLTCQDLNVDSQAMTIKARGDVNAYLEKEKVTSAFAEIDLATRTLRVKFQGNHIERTF